MKTTRVHIEDIKGQTFSGYVYTAELPESIRIMFPEAGKTINVDGEYFVEWHRDIPNPVVEGHSVLFLGNNQVHVNEIVLDYSRLEEDLYLDGPIDQWEELKFELIHQSVKGEY